MSEISLKNKFTRQKLFILVFDSNFDGNFCIIQVFYSTYMLLEKIHILLCSIYLSYIRYKNQIKNNIHVKIYIYMTKIRFKISNNFDFSLFSMHYRQK